ncbi:MAG: hypothetical protein ABSF22_20875 [Bryobacteraceae bacterium]
MRTKVDEALELYAAKGVFRSFSRVLSRNKVVYYRMLWHKDRFYDLVFDATKQSLRFPVVLPKVPRPMYDDFKKFVAQRQSEETIAHRRIDPKKVRISCSLKNGDISLLFIAKDRDYEYATQKLIHLMHEIFLLFLRDGTYYEYMIETFEIDRDQMV